MSALEPADALGRSMPWRFLRRLAPNEVRAGGYRSGRHGRGSLHEFRHGLLLCRPRHTPRAKPARGVSVAAGSEAVVSCQHPRLAPEAGANRGAPGELHFNVTRCRYAEMYESIGLRE